MCGRCFCDVVCCFRQYDANLVLFVFIQHNVTLVEFVFRQYINLVVFVFRQYIVNLVVFVLTQCARNLPVAILAFLLLLEPLAGGMIKLILVFEMIQSENIRILRRSKHNIVIDSFQMIQVICERERGAVKVVWLIFAEILRSTCNVREEHGLAPSALPPTSPLL